MTIGFSRNIVGTPKVSALKIENVYSRCGTIKKLKIIPFPVENSRGGRDYFGNF